METGTGWSIGIDPDAALRLFGVDRTASLRDLNASYRTLAQQYHPDYHAERKAWAHEAMVKINAAYDAAVDYLASLRYEEVEARLDGEIYAHDRFTELFTAVANSVLEGIFIYYQYGLENPFIREQGVPRFRYRLAVKKVAGGVSRLEQLQSPNAIDAETLKVFATFSAAFLQCMRMDRVNRPTAGRSEAIAYRHYRTASELLDDAIRTLFFRAELSRPGARAAPQGLAVAHAGFMKVITECADSSWVTEAAIKSYLLDSVQKLDALSERVPALRIGG